MIRKSSIFQCINVKKTYILYTSYVLFWPLLLTAFDWYVSTFVSNPIPFEPLGYICKFFWLSFSDRRREPSRDYLYKKSCRVKQVWSIHKHQLDTLGQNYKKKKIILASSDRRRLVQFSYITKFVRILSCRSLWFPWLLRSCNIEYKIFEARRPKGLFREEFDQIL